MKKFRVRKMKHSDLAQLINVDNCQEFYTYNGHQDELNKNKIYLEKELVFIGAYVSLKGQKVPNAIPSWI